jgi:hypothetical protein
MTQTLTWFETSPVCVQNTTHALTEKPLLRPVRWSNMTKIIHTGIDARGNTYSLVRTKNGGCKYIWDAGHCWADFTPAHRNSYIDTADGIV